MGNFSGAKKSLTSGVSRSDGHVDESDRYDGFLISFLPIVIAHIVFPPLSYFDGEKVGNEIIDDFLRIVYHLAPKKVLNRKFVESLVNDSAKGRRSSRTMLTYIFIHGSYEHMSQNLLGAINPAYPIYKEFGKKGLYFLFLSGGVFASLPTFFRKQQNRAFRKLVSDEFGIVSRPINAVIKPPTKLCGSSGAICALIGCDLSLCVRDCYQTIKYVLSSKDDELYGYYTIKFTRIMKGDSFTTKFVKLSEVVKTKLRKLLNTAKSPDLKLKILSAMYSIFEAVNYCRSELNAINPMRTNSPKLLDTGFKETLFDLLAIGHAEHIQGFLYGVTFGCVFGIMIPAIKKKFFKKNDKSVLWLGLGLGLGYVLDD